MDIVDAVFVYQMKEKKELRWHGRIHSHEDGQYEIHYFLGGMGSFSDGGTRFSLDAGLCFVTAPHVVHSIRTEESSPVTYYAVLLSLAPEEIELKDVMDSLCRTSPHRIGTDHRFFFEEIKEHGLAREGYRRQAACHQLFSLLYRMADNAENVSSVVGDHHIERALRFMQRHVLDTITLKDISQDLHLTASYFIRLFQKRMRQSPMKYFMKLKIEIAGALLTTTDRPIKDIAAHLNFSSEFHFSRQFKLHTGLSPSSYRSQYQQEAGYVRGSETQAAPIPRFERLRHHPITVELVSKEEPRHV